MNEPNPTEPLPEPPKPAASESAPPPAPKKHGLELHWQILIGLAIGLFCGIGANWYGSRAAVREQPGVYDKYGHKTTVNGVVEEKGNGIDDRVDAVAAVAEPLGKVFLRLILMVVLPLVVSALTLGVMGLGSAAAIGRIGLKTLFFTLILSTSSVLVGVGLANFFRPGDGLSKAESERLQQLYAGEGAKAADSAKKARAVQDVLLDMIPENPIQEMAGAVDGSSKGNGMLSVMFFSLICGVALHFVPADKRATLIGLLEGLFEVSMVIVGFAMKIAPYGVALLVFSIVSRLGPGLLTLLGWFVLTVFLGYAIQLFGVYSLLLWICTGKNPVTFFRQASEAMLTAFGTSSSNATLPTSMRVAETELGLPPSISRFVLTIGATGNQNGTALYEGMVVLFLAQVFGVQLTLGQQFTVVLMAILAGVGTAGVPGGSLPLIVILLHTVKVPPEGITIILGIDRFLDMGRTVLNVTGDLCLATCVAAQEKAPPASDDPLPQPPLPPE